MMAEPVFMDGDGDENEGNGESAPPAKRQKLGGTYRLMLLVPGELVSSLIGKSGAVIKEMEQECEGMISFEKLDEVIMGERLRIVSIYGENLMVLSAGQAAILQRLRPPSAQGDPAAAEKPRLRLLVQNDLVGPIIGPRGAHINDVTSQTGAFVGFCKAEEMPPGSVLRMCTISGESDAIALAVQLVLERHEQLLQEKYSCSSGQMARAGSNTRAILGDTAPPPARSGGHPETRERHREDSGHRGSLPAPPLPQRGTPGIAAAPSQRAKQPPTPPPNYAASSRNPPPPPRAEPPPPPLPTPPPPTRPDVYTQASSESGSSRQAPDSGGPPQMSFTVWLPNESVGRFIGGRGVNIKRITDTTHVFLSVQKEEQNANFNDISGATLRPVLLRGPPEAVLQAHNMVIQILAELDPDHSFSTMVVPGPPPA